MTDLSSESIELINSIQSDKTTKSSKAEFRSPNAERCKWQEIHGKTRGNPWVITPTSKMLLEDYTILRGIKVHDTERGGWKDAFFEVTYDRDYVVAWLSAIVINPFSKLDFRQVQKLIGDAYRLHKETQK